MFERVIVPIDGSDFSWRALQPARALAAQCGAVVEVMQVVVLPDDVVMATELIREHLERHGMSTGTDVHVVVMGDTIASTIAARVETTTGSVVVMSSVGRGRSAALIGSIAEELLGALHGPVVVVGPDSAVDVTDYRGHLVIPVDGSNTSESALAVGAAWGIGLEARPWIVTVADPDTPAPADSGEAAYPSRLARDLASRTQHDVDYDVLHGGRPDRAVCDYAAGLPASLIVASTHGRTGLARIAAGSVAMGIVRNAPCPVVLHRPPQLT